MFLVNRFCEGDQGFVGHDIPPKDFQVMFQSGQDGLGLKMAVLVELS